MLGLLPPSRLHVILVVAFLTTSQRTCFSLSLVGQQKAHVGVNLDLLDSNSPLPSRRSAVLALISSLSVITTPVASCQAAEDETSSTAAPTNSRGGKPFAPLNALLPAARLKAVVDPMYDLSISLSKSNKEPQLQALSEMNQIWTNRQPLFRKEEKFSRATPASAQLTTGVSSANKQQYQTIRKDLSMADRMTAMLNQADVERQWGMLQYQELKREQGNELRAALNFYTSQLEFGNAYLLTAPAEDRKRLIRNDQLPSLTDVITSDLDLRDLYRNDFLTALEDANAEVAYQLKQSPNEVDVADVVELMEQAHASLQKWFDLIAPTDVKEAMETVRKEGRNQTVD